MLREVQFLKDNADRWRDFERRLNTSSGTDADEFADLYIRLTDDLAWAKTFYPNSKTTAYLNSLTSRVHQKIYKNKKENTGRVIRLWKDELPLLFYKHRKKMLASFLVFAIAVLIGILSAVHDPLFVRLILGDRYVDMTLANIQKHDPMAVYKSQYAMNMFLGITLNNIYVSFLTFLGGLLLAIGAGYFLMKNGIMLGAFLSMFVKYHLLKTSLSVVFIHGTLEISALIIAGTAGFVMGSGILFPGSYSRLQSFRQSAREGLKMTVGLVPIFITAAFLESFVTRYTGMPAFLSLLIIGSSLTLVLGYFVFYPQHHYNQISKL